MRIGLRSPAKIVIIPHKLKAIPIVAAIDGKSAGQVPVAISEAVHICEKKTRQSANFCFHNATNALSPQKLVNSINQTGIL